MELHSKLYVAGHRGMVGSAIVRALERAGYTNLVVRTSAELDLREQSAVRAFFAAERPEYVFLAAAKVGGIVANNTYRAEFLYENLAIQTNVIHEAWASGARKLLFLGSSCIYPKLAPQPLREDALLTGLLEATNEPYAIAKIAGIKQAEAYRDQYGFHAISVMPTNLYGPNDNYDLEKSHVLPAMIRKFFEAKLRGEHTVTLWGDGSPLREFLHADDLADASVFLMQQYDGRDFLNVGTGMDLPIRELAELVRRAVGWEGRIVWDTTRPNGTPRKLMDVSRLHALGWQHRISLDEGLRRTVAEFTEEYPRRWGAMNS
jgi:GDP-L-fucose synthase